jgi:CrcB protein
MGKWAGLILGSLAGGVGRYVLAGAVYRRFGVDFPYGTLVVNLTGCFLMGLFNNLAEVKLLLGPSARGLLMIGFCGAFTTLSSLMLETSNLMKDGQMARALANVAVTVIGGFLLFRFGEILADILF